jgi:pimeloyl-ACP methyl ester carboxylesterase
MSAGRKLPGAPEPMHRFAGAGGVLIACDTWGEAAAPLVVLLHGGGQTRHAWKGTGMQLAAAGYRVAAYDARGHGDSDWAADCDYDYRAMALDLRSVVAALGAERAALVGASLGGGTSLLAVGEGLVAATALVMVDVAPYIEPAGVSRIQAFMSQSPEGFDSLEDVADAIASYQPHRARPRRLDGIAKNVRLTPDGRYRWHWDPAYRAAHVDQQHRRDRLSDCARKLTVPTLLVRGLLSDLLSEEGARDFLELCPHSEYVSVGDAAHMVVGDRNDIFARAVVDFLARTVPAAA